MQSDGGEEDKDNPTKTKKQNQPTQTPSLHHPVVFPLHWGETSETLTADFYGPEFSKEEHGSDVCALAKAQRNRQMDFTSLEPVTSGHCTEWQKPGHNASPGHWYALTQVRSCGSEVAMQIMPWKSPFL